MAPVLDLPFLSGLLRHGCAFALALAIGRLLHSRITREYRFFATVCAYALMRWAVMNAFPSNRTEAYLWTWSIGDIGSTLIWGGVVWELFNLCERQCPGIGNYGKRAFAVIALISLLIGAGLNSQGDIFRTKVFFAGFLRAYLMTAYAIMMILTTVFFRYVPIPLPRNLEIHRALVTLYCAMNAVAYVWLNLHTSKPVAQWVGFLTLLGATCIYMVYAVMLRRDGQLTDAMPHPIEIARANREHDQLMDVLERAAAQR